MFFHPFGLLYVCIFISFPASPAPGRCPAARLRFVNEFFSVSFGSFGPFCSSFGIFRYTFLFSFFCLNCLFCIYFSLFMTKPGGIGRFRKASGPGSGSRTGGKPAAGSRNFYFFQEKIFIFFFFRHIIYVRQRKRISKADSPPRFPQVSNYF